MKFKKRDDFIARRFRELGVVVENREGVLTEIELEPGRVFDGGYAGDREVLDRIWGFHWEWTIACFCALAIA